MYLIMQTQLTRTLRPPFENSSHLICPNIFPGSHWITVPKTMQVAPENNQTRLFRIPSAKHSSNVHALVSLTYIHFQYNWIIINFPRRTYFSLCFDKREKQFVCAFRLHIAEMPSSRLGRKLKQFLRETTSFSCILLQRDTQYPGRFGAFL